MRFLNSGLAVIWRIRADYFVASRRAEYLAMLLRAREAGYQLMSLVEFFDYIHEKGFKNDTRCLVLRHDIDVANIAGNKMFYDVEAECGARASYYFRLSTVKPHIHFIERLLSKGFEVGYHYEEASTIAKSRNLRTREATYEYKKEIQDKFRLNCQIFRERYNPHLRSVCAHGDWINRALKVLNHEFINEQILSECGLSFEAYQDSFKSQFDAYVSDAAQPPRQWAKGYSIMQALDESLTRIYLLTHERNWYPGVQVNTVENLHRAWEGLRYWVTR